MRMRIGPVVHSTRDACYTAASRYLSAQRSLRTPSSRRSRYGLDWLNFFLADVQTGFGTFVAFYLARLGWPQASIGMALAVGSFVGVLGQIPGGALSDAIHWKRALAAIGILMICAAALILALLPDRLFVFLAEILHGLTAGIITPAIGAMSLGIVGRRAMSSRTGRNYRFAAAGNGLTAAAMGAAGAYLSESAIFLTAALLCVPALIALASIRADEIDYTRARNAAKGDTAKPARLRDLARNRALLMFAGCIMLFQLADASMLPLLGENIARQSGAANLQMSSLIIVPQIVVAILAPWVGYHSEVRGRRPLLLVGFGLEPIRAAILAFTTAYPFLVVVQLLNGISSAIITVLTVLVITDLTAGTGRFNIAQGTLGAVMGIAASISTIGTGYVDEAFGPGTGFIVVTIIALLATGLLWVFQQETKPADYAD
jgi:MFS family permease